MKSEGFHAFDIRLLILGLISMMSISAFAQKANQYSSKELKRLAVSAERNNDPETAAIYYAKYIEKKPNDIEIIYQLADKNRFLGKPKKALGQYKSVIESKKSKKYPLASFYYAQMLVASGKCEDAIPVYDQFRKDYRGEKDDRKYIRLAKIGVTGCKMKSGSGSSSILIKELNDDINGSHMEGSPIFLSENEIIYNSLKTKGKSVFENGSDNLPSRLFYVAKLEDGEWKDKSSWNVLQNFNNGEIGNGAFNMNKTRFYFSACLTNAMGEVSCDLFRINKEGNGWSNPIKLPPTVNTKYTETQIAVGVDEKERETIYFVSNRKEGKGGLDIWYSTYYEKKDEYREAKNCGSKVNSVGDEITPFINPLNRQLYFSSNGHPSFGGFDVYKSAGERSKWSEPKNIGASINTYSDELYYVLQSDGDEGVFASNRVTKQNKKNGACCDNLFYFKELDKINIRVTGKISSISADKLKINDVKMKLFLVDDLGEKFYLQSASTDENGDYSLRLEPNSNYILKAEKDGFLSEEKRISTLNKINSEEMNLGFDLTEISDKAVQIENVYYEYNSPNLTEDALKTIDTTIYQVLIQNPTIIIEIGSHSDNVGSDAYNKNLSQKRAESLMRYLRLKGIDKSRMKAKGYGETEPIAPNKNSDGSDNESGRAKNRRTEFKVIGKIDLKEAEDD